jgi:hypothetical protein
MRYDLWGAPYTERPGINNSMWSHIGEETVGPNRNYKKHFIRTMEMVV